MTGFTCGEVAHAALGEPMNRKGAELLYRCPRPEHHAHGDLNPSLSVNTRKNVWACFPCAASGTAWQLAAFIARLDPSDKPAIKRWLRDRGLLKGKGPRALHAKRRQVAVYEYKNAQGNPVARKLRFMPKSFAWQRFENGTWINGLADVKPPLYRWPKIAGERFVVLTEGEKDTDAGSAIGLPCTTSGGVNSFRPDHADALRGKDVVIIRDSDDPGREYAEKVAAMLNGKAARIRVCEIPDSKDLAEALEKGVPLEVLHTLFENTPAQRTTSGAELIRRFENIFRRFVIAGTGVPLVGALYAFMTHCFENFSWISYLAFVSALESCGKSHAADIVGWASARPEILVNITPASLFRLITEEKPTVVVDEAEVLDGKDGTAIALRAVLHAGCSPDDGIIRVQPNTHTLERFSPWCPKIFCAIESLPRVLASRCIVVNLKRKKPSEKTEKFIRSRVKSELRELAGEIGAWVSQHEKEVRYAYESLPDESLEDRRRENFAPLEAILSVADSSRLGELRLVRESVGTSESSSTGDSALLRLLDDVRQIFVDRSVDRIASAELASALAEIETSPWADWSHGKPISKQKVARLLSRLGIATGTVRIGAATPKGYYLEDFADAFSRYLPAQNCNTATSRLNISKNSGFESATADACGGLENEEVGDENAARGVVAVSKPEVGGSASNEEIEL